MAENFTDAGALSYGTLIQLNVEDATPPTNAYIGVDDVLQVFIATSQPSGFVRLFARVLLPNGNIVPNDWTYAATNGRQGQNFYQRVAEGFLLSLTVYGSSATVPGQTYVRVSLIRGTIAVNGLSQVLIQGYSTLQNPLSWPASELQPQSAGRGNIRSITGTTPAPGQNISEVVPFFALWRLIAFTFTLAASAAGGPRTVFLSIDDGANQFTYIGTAATVPAAGTNVFSFADGYVSSAVAVYQMAPLPSQLYMPTGYRIRTSTSGLDVADAYFGVQYVVEEWLQA
jgi:hypothetical protein